MRAFEGFQRGVNLGGWISQCVSYEKEHFDTFIRKHDLETIAGWGLDHVRLPIDYDVIQNEDESFKEDGMKHIADCIEWADACGLNVVLDLHRARGYMFDPQACPDPDRFFHDEALQASFIRLWEELARRFGHRSDRVVFELLNEVTNPAVAEAWNAIARRAIRAIRAIAPDVRIMYGGVNYNSVTAIPQLGAPCDDKIIYTFHCYEPLVFTHQAAYWVVGMQPDFHIGYPKTVAELREAGSVIPQASCGALFDERLKPDDIGTTIFERLFEGAFAFADRVDVPLYCGEYGVIDRAPLPETVAWFRDIHAVFEKYKVGRAVWNYKNKDFGLTDVHYADRVDEIVKHL